MAGESGIGGKIRRLVRRRKDDAPAAPRKATPELGAPARPAAVKAAAPAASSSGTAKVATKAPAKSAAKTPAAAGKSAAKAVKAPAGKAANKAAKKAPATSAAAKAATSAKTAKAAGKPPAKAPAKAAKAAKSSGVSPAKAPAKAAKTSKSPAKTPAKAATKGAPARAGKAPGGASSVAKAPAKAAKSTTATGAKAAAAKKAAATKKAAPAEAAVRETARKTAAKAAPAKAAAAQTSAAMVPAPDGRQEEGRVPTPSKASVSTAPKPPAKATGGRAAVLPGESPWTKGELAEIRGELETQAVDLRGEITDAESAWAALQRDSGEGAGDDQADAGTKTFEREHELSIAANSRDLLSQVERALQRIDDSTYGVCESCGKPIGKGRLQAFPRATLCMECKQREERR